MKSLVFIVFCSFLFSACGDALNKKDGPAPANNGFVLGACGNSSVDFGEDCDGTTTKTCASVGFASGIVQCSSQCTFDTSECVALDTCQNGQLDTAEICDGTNFRGQTCGSLGFASGELTCTSGCTLDTSNCGNGGGGSSCARAYDNFFEKCEESQNLEPSDRDESIATCNQIGDTPEREAQLKCALLGTCDQIIACLTQLVGE